VEWVKQEDTMDTMRKIKLLYGLTENGNYGSGEDDIAEAENKLKKKLPGMLREYYLTLGDIASDPFKYYLRLLYPSEIKIIDDKYLIFYEECYCDDHIYGDYWGININDLEKYNPMIYGTYRPLEKTDWSVYSKTLEGFLFAIAYRNAHFMYGAVYFDEHKYVDSGIISAVENNWKEIRLGIKRQYRFFANNENELIILETDSKNITYKIELNANNKKQYAEMLKKIKLKWKYKTFI
jgi:hypothetical protein